MDSRPANSAAPAPFPSPAPPTPQPDQQSTAQRAALHAELLWIRNKSIEESGFATALSSRGRSAREEADSIQAATIEARREAGMNDKVMGGIAYTAAELLPGGFLVGAAAAGVAESVFGSKGAMNTEQRSAYENQVADAALLGNTAASMRKTRDKLAKRKQALETLDKGTSPLLVPISRIGAGLVALTLILTMCLVDMAFAGIFPLLGFLALPVCILAPWLWYRGQLGHLARAMNDYPGLVPSGGPSFPRSYAYLPVCGLVAVLIVGEIALIGWWAFQMARMLVAEWF